MIPTMTFHDLLAIFLAGVVVGVLLTAYLIHKLKQFIKRKAA